MAGLDAPNQTLEPTSLPQVNVTGNYIPDIAFPEPESIGFLPKLLAGIAAVKGNVGPALQLLEMGRKADSYKKFAPVLGEINKARARGDLDTAQSLLLQFASRLSATNPELIPTISSTLEKVQNRKAALDTQETTAKLNLENLGPDDPRSKPWRILLDLSRQGKLVDPDTVRQYSINLPYQANVTQDAVTLTDRLSGRSLQQTLPAVPNVPNDKAASFVAGELGLLPSEQVNILRDIPVYRKNAQGEEIDIGPGVKTQLIQALNTEARNVALADEAKATPLDPVTNTRLLQQGINPRSLNRRELTPQQLQQADEEIYRRLKEIEIAKGQADLDKPVALLPDLHIYDSKEGAYNAKLKPADVMANPERYALLRGKDKATLDRVLNIRKNLTIFSDALTQAQKDGTVSSGSDPIGRISNLLDNTLNPIFANPNVTALQVAQALARNALEAEVNPDGVKSRAYAQATAALSSPNITLETARAALGVLQTTLDEDTRRLLGRSTAENFKPFMSDTPQTPQPPRQKLRFKDAR